MLLPGRWPGGEPGRAPAAGGRATGAWGLGAGAGGRATGGGRAPGGGRRTGGGGGRKPGGGLCQPCRDGGTMNTGRYTTGPHQPGGRGRGPHAGWKWIPTVKNGVAGLTTNPNPVHGL